MNINISNRLSFKLARNTVIVALLLGMFLNLFQVLIDYLNEKTALDQDINALITISHTPASQIAYNIDSRLAEELLEGLLKHPAIIEAEIVDNDNRILARRSRQTEESSYRWLSDLLFDPTRNYSTTLHVQQLSDVDLGNLNVVVDTYPSGTAFLKRAAFTLISGFIKSLALSVLLLFVFYLMLTKPLLKVINAVSEVDPETPEKTRLPVPKGHQQDEIGILVESTNDHLQSIEKSLQRVRKAESRLKNYSEQLEQIVDTRTRELSDKNDLLIKSNQELVIAKEEAIRRAKARANFLANMSHEIRTPFNGVLGMISLTMEESLTDRQKRQLDVAYKSGVALLDLLNDILDISKVEAGKLTLESIDFNLRQTIQDVASLLVQNANAKDIDLFVDIAPGFPEMVMGDPTRIRQVVNNLTGNAIKFTETGSVTIKLMLESAFVVIQVIDTGIGISDNVLEKIFAPFSQAHTDTTRKYGGTGLGLALCRQLVNHMSGQLDVQSKQNDGSTFTVRLPLEIVKTAPAFSIDPDLRTYQFLIVMANGNKHCSSLADLLHHWNLRPQILCYDKPTELNELDQYQSNKWIFITDTPDIVDRLPEAANARILFIEGRTENKLAKEKLKNPAQIIHAPVAREFFYQNILQICKPSSIRAQLPLNQPATNLKENTTLNILLVEDNQVNQLVAKTILKKLGYQVDIANNGQEAVDKLKTKDKAFDIVLMDCHMPIMDGYEASQFIRTELGLKSLPIIAVTANVMHGDKEKCFAAGMNDYITKPYEKHVLIDIINKWQVSTNVTPLIGSQPD